MAATSQLDRVAMVVLRYLRMPVFVLILVYAIGIIGMALIPGRDAAGNVEYMSLFHAFYFFTYTATTTGFGEIPNTFTDTQRLWTIVCLYMGAVSWLYAISAIIRLMQNPHFLMALSEHRFAGAVRRIDQPFVIICGFGDTGSLLARGLSEHWMGAVVIDPDSERIKAHELRDYRVKMPSLCADPGVPKHLIDAGVRSPLCRAVVVLSDGEENNLRITTMARVLNPDLPILCRSTSPEYGARLAELDSITVINPFEIFAQLLVLAITAPKLHNLNAFLVRAKGVKLGQALEIPVGDWILCGYGRMGQWLHHYLERQGIHPVVIDPDMEKTQGPSRVIHGYASQQTLLAAGIEHAAGVVAGTPSDHSNLEILMCVHALRRDAFTILRQNNHENQPAFDLADAKLVLQSSQTTARRILKHLISPQAQRLIDHLEMKGEAVTGGLVERLRLVLGEKAPHLWRVTLRAGETGAAVDWMQDGGMLKLGELLRNPYERLEKIACIPLAIKRGETNMMLPDDDEMLCLGDEILLCGTQGCETLLSASLNNPYTLHYLLTGKDAPRGYVFRWFASWRARSAEASS